MIDDFVIVFSFWKYVDEFVWILKKMFALFRNSRLDIGVILPNWGLCIPCLILASVNKPETNDIVLVILCCLVGLLRWHLGVSYNFWILLHFACSNPRWNSRVDRAGFITSCLYWGIQGGEFTYDLRTILRDILGQNLFPSWMSYVLYATSFLSICFLFWLYRPIVLLINETMLSYQESQKACSREYM